MENVRQTRSALLPMLRTAASGAGVGTMGEEAEVEVQVAQVQAEVQVERANASTPSLELTIHAGIKADQIEFNNYKNITIWHRGDPETLCGSGGPGFCYVHCNADCRDIKHTASTSRSLSLSIFLTINSIVRGTCNSFYLMTEE